MGEFLENNSLLFNLTISMLGIAVAILLYLKAKPYKFLTLKMFSTNIVSDTKNEDIEIHYKGIAAKQLTETKVSLTNTGNKTIVDTDIARLNPICIKAKEGYRILDVSLVASSSEDGNFSISTKKNASSDEYILNFDFIERKEGCIIQIIHDGINSSAFSISGKVMGGNRINSKKYINLLNFLLKFDFYGKKPAFFATLVFSMVLMEESLKQLLFFNILTIICYSYVFLYLISKMVLVNYSTTKLPKNINFD